MHAIPKPLTPFEEACRDGLEAAHVGVMALSAVRDLLISNTPNGSRNLEVDPDELCSLLELIEQKIACGIEAAHNIWRKSA